MESISQYKNENEKKNKKIKKRIINQEEKHKGYFSNFLRKHSVCICNYDKNENIQGLARALFELTYQCVPQVYASTKEEMFFIEDVEELFSKKYTKSNRPSDWSFDNKRKIRK